MGKHSCRTRSCGSWVPDPENIIEDPCAGYCRNKTLCESRTTNATPAPVYSSNKACCYNDACHFYKEGYSNRCSNVLYHWPRSITFCGEYLPKDEVPSAESDSTESELGTKFDDGKPQLSKLFTSFPDALSAVALLHVEGAKKHGSLDNWKAVEGGYNRYTDSLLRHIMSSVSGEDYDQGDPGFLHDINALWNALTRLQLRLEGKDIPLKRAEKED